jgi:type I restriction enzyme S subunit
VAFSEQHDIVRRVSALFALADKIEARLAAATAAVERITQSVLANAFRGKLVETEASLARREGRDYEPAAKLLERVKTDSMTALRPDPKRRRKTVD